jgi:serine/threonine protein phosphatase PrpC
MPHMPCLPNGCVAAYHDNSCHGEDAYVSRELSPCHALDAVLDGATGSGGRIASQQVAEALQRAVIGGLDDVLAVLEAVNRDLYRRGRGRFFLTTLSLALKLGDTVHVVHVGDSPVYLIRGGKAMALTSAATGAIVPGMTQVLGQQERPRYKHRHLALRPRDWLVLATDGLVQNVAPGELAALLAQVAGPQEAVSALDDLLAAKRRANRGRSDEHSSFIRDDTTAVFRYVAWPCHAAVTPAG